MRKKYVFLLLLSSFFFSGYFRNNSNASSPCLLQESLGSQIEQRFYKKPTFQNLKLMISSAASQQDQHSQDMMVLYVALVLNTYPEIAKHITKKFSSFSVKEQEIIIKATKISKNGGRIPVQKMVSMEIYKKIKEDTTTIPIDHLETLIPQNPKEVDFLWVGFFVTQNPKYIQRILEVASPKNKQLLFLAYEIRNRVMMAQLTSQLTGKEEKPDLEDILPHIGQNKPETKKTLNQVLVCQSAMWSLDNIAKQYPEVREIIKTLIKRDPSLDYSKRIQELLSPR